MKKNRKRLGCIPSSSDPTTPRSGPTRRGRLIDRCNENQSHESPVNGMTQVPVQCSFPAVLHRSAECGRRTANRSSAPSASSPQSLTASQPTASERSPTLANRAQARHDKRALPRNPPKLDAPAPADRLHRSIGPRTHGHPRYYVENIRSKSLVRLNGNKRQIPNHRCHAPPIPQIRSAGVDFSPYRHAQLLNRFFFRPTTATASGGCLQRASRHGRKNWRLVQESGRCGRQPLSSGPFWLLTAA